MTDGKAQKTEFLVLGSGVAGMRAAIELGRAGHVLVLSKGDAFESASDYAQHGIAVALGDDEKVSLHFHDTLEAGDGLCREAAVRVLVEEGRRCLKELMEWGVRIERDVVKASPANAFLHAAHTLHSAGCSIGSEILHALVDRAKKLGTVKLQPQSFAVDLLVEGHRVVGVSCFDETTGALLNIYATAVLIATGGLGQVYTETTNPPVATGDGMAMAFRSGALLSDMEFVQFLPTALYLKGAPRLLISEVLREQGAHLRNIELERFMPHYHEAGDHAPRDIVCRAIVMEMQKGRSDFVYLDLTSLKPDLVKTRFPRTYATCMEYNLDITEDLVPVHPAAHYAIGGIATDLSGATTLGGLYAVGEAAATGVHGANRLANNSLLEGLVFGARAGAAMIARRAAPKPMSAPASPKSATKPSATATALKAPAGTDTGRHDKGDEPRKLGPDRLVNEVRELMWNKAGIIRHGRDLREALYILDRLEPANVDGATWPSRCCFEAQNILDAARAIVACALAREESRGVHYRADFPLKSQNAPPKHSYLRRDSKPYFA